jgi:serine phosphatase RsbU (regulator of sigma subunit)/putative methionine-R-sulfoxide reductase with GAF domain
MGEKLISLAQQAFAGAKSASETMTAQRDLIVEMASRLLGSQASFWMPEETLRLFLGKAQSKAVVAAWANQPASTRSSLMEQSLERRAVFYRLREGEGRLMAENTPLEDEIMAVAAPLFMLDGDGQATGVLGVLQVERREGSPLSGGEIALLDGLISQAAMGLQASLQIFNERWRLEQLSLVQQVSTQTADVRDLEVLSRRVANLILETFNYYYVTIFTLEPDQDILHVRASAGPRRLSQSGSAVDVVSPSLVVHVGQGIIGHVAQTGEEVLARDVRDESLYRHLDALPETRSEFALPLRIEEQLLGVLDVQSDQPDDFDETDILVLRALAVNISFAVEGARLYQALHQRARQLSAVYEVSNAIVSILDQEKLLSDVVGLIQKRFSYPFVHLYSVHPGRRKVIFEAGSGWRSPILRGQGFAYDLDDPQGIISWVARHAESVLANDVSQEPRYRPSPLPPDETRSEFTIPLKFGGEVLGILDLQSEQLNAFSEEERFLFEALADNIAIAMRNANLYRSESWRRQVAESLREVAGLLSADVDLTQVLEAILEELGRTLPLDLAAIWLLDEASDQYSEPGAPFLHLAAVRGEGLTDLELHTGLGPEDVLECNPSEEDKLLPDQASRWLLDALEADQPVTRAPYGLFEPLGAILDFPDDYSAIAAPLRIGELRLGVLSLAHRFTGRYGSEARAMMAAFASYAAVAIQNTRLYEEAHEQAWVSTVLLQVADATQSQTNLNELLATVIRITPLLTGVVACMIYILDEESTFVPTVASGLSPEQQGEFERWRFAPGDVPVLDEMLADQQPVILHGDERDLRLSSILFIDGEPDQTLESGLLVLVPFLARGEVLGAFLVQYDGNLAGNTGGKSLEAFLDERLAIMQGIAYQTAIGVENIGLLKAQREEAYVSVALLQVAQAVVSSSELEEALGAIVRITPILVGVKRTVIFLWEGGKAIFRLSQEYGLPRDIAPHVYNPGEFPLLDAVRQMDTLLALPLRGEDDEAEDVLDFWCGLASADLESMDRYLDEEPRLLLAFPLSVKGDVLGVLLVEEPEAGPVEHLRSSPVNRRLREKRLEIIKGITQQAALAVQNDLLQREMVESERLEREMQLAREIQATFLPEQVPELPGWDLAAYWRTAREVGGDFYDFFELPGNRLGLVIADVADKGVPAALFMILVRTLLRATVLQTGSPATVLEQVNDLLVPDAPKGMFVTLVYAVLSLDSGELEVANAGHNLPLILRVKDGEVERISHGGMALGVQAGNSIEARKILLEQGDFLILYTDGITEAFSPQGEIYGEGRLRQMVESLFEGGGEDGKVPPGARAMLEVIDASVTDFIGGTMPSDDLTLMVLKRLG